MSAYRSMHEQATRADTSGQHQWTPLDMIRRLPGRYVPFAYGIIQAAMTTGVATAIAIARTVGHGAGSNNA
jgi:hypothetical protein